MIPLDVIYLTTKKVAMNLGRSKNPMFEEKTIAKAKALELERKARTGGGLEETDDMTVAGAVNKTVLLLGILMITTLWSYSNPLQVYMPIGALGAAAVYMLTSFKPHLSPTTAPMFAILEGLFVGTVSAIYAASFEGIIFQAVSATIGVLLTMLMIYRSGIIPVTQKFRMVVSMAVGAIMIVYLVSWIGSFAGFTVPFLHESGAIGIGVTAVIIVVASLNLLLDFDNFEKGEAMNAPKHMEWYYGMGLLFTLVWLYIEFLRLLSKLQDD